MSIFLWPKPAWVSFRCLRNLPFHPSSADSAILFKVELGVQSTNAPGFAVGSISVTFLLSLRCDLACGASRVVGTWARMCTRRHGGCVQVGAEAELPVLQCNKGILLLEPRKKKKKTVSSMSTPATASLTVSGQAGKAFILSVAALKSLTQSRCSFQGTF